ncbi:hypothetical protein D5366_01220 [Neokomagataea tanensis]|uniref:TM2 domain-containing protein n=1 Tax=Neokomagataea tanensis TaxID=661191 RepID=A0A4Y6V6J0_9PROT|nr:hypothetical protein D5366_01220 [Neokomagataea tanensis]
MFGLHKLYLGYNKAGIITLSCAMQGDLLLGIPVVIIYAISFIEFVLYMIKSKEGFYQDYELSKRVWL